jgi:hypothetical protein
MLEKKLVGDILCAQKFPESLGWQREHAVCLSVHLILIILGEKTTA